MAPVHKIDSYSVASSASSSSKTSWKTGQNCGCRKGEYRNTSGPLTSTEISFDDAFFKNATERFHNEFRSFLADWDDTEDINDTWFQRETSLSKRLRPETEASSYKKIRDNKFAAVVRENGDYEVMMNICELRLKDVKVRITGEKYVVVEGSKDEGNVIKNCRQSPRNFLYQFSLPDNVTSNAVSATLSLDGVLTITIPAKVNTERQPDICGTECHRAKTPNIIRNINDNIGQKCKVIEIQNAPSSVRTTGNCSVFSCKSSLESATGQDQGELQTLGKLKDCREEVSLEKKEEYLKKDCSFTTSCNQSKANSSQSLLRENRHVKETIIPITMEVLKHENTTNSSERDIRISNDSSGTKKASFYNEDSLHQQRYTNGNGESRTMGEPNTNCTGSQHETLSSKTFSNNKDIEKRKERLQHCQRNDDLDLNIKTQTVCCDAKYNDLLPNPTSITKSTHLNNTECIKQKMQSGLENSALFQGKNCVMSQNVCKETEENKNSNAENPAIETSRQSPEMEIEHFPHDDMTKSPNSESPVQLDVVEKGRFLEESTFLSMRQSLTKALEEILSINNRLPVHDDLIRCYRRYQEDNAMECEVLSFTHVEHSSMKFVVDVFGLMEQSITVSIMNGKEIRIGGQHSHMKGKHQNTKDFSKTFLLQEGSSVESASASISSDGFLMITINKESCPESIANEPRNEEMIQDNVRKEDSKKVNSTQNINFLPQESQGQMGLDLSDDDQESSFDVMSAGSRNGWTSEASLNISEEQSIDVTRKSGAQAKMRPTATLSSGESEERLTFSKDKLNSLGMEESGANRNARSNEAVLENESESNREKFITHSKDNLNSLRKDDSKANTDVVFIEAVLEDESDANTSKGFTDSKDKLDSVCKEESKDNKDVMFIKAVLQEESKANTDVVFIEAVLEDESDANICTRFTNSKDKLDSVCKEESKDNKDVMFIKAVLQEESKANTDIGFTNFKDNLDSVQREESVAITDVRSIKAAIEKESEANTDIVFTNSKDKLDSVWKEETEANRDVEFIEDIQEEESQANRYIGFTNSNEKLISVWKEESEANRDAVFIQAVQEEESQVTRDIGFTNSKDKLISVWKEESDANRDVVFTEGVQEEKSKANIDTGFPNSEDELNSVWNEESKAIRDVKFTKAVLEEESQANTHTGFANFKDKLQTASKEKLEDNPDVVFIKSVLEEESETTRDVMVFDSKDNHYSVGKKNTEANRDGGLIEDTLHTVVKEESDANRDERLINSKDEFYSASMEETEAGTDVGFNQHKRYSAQNEESVFCKISSKKEHLNQIQKEISTAEKTEHGYFHPDTQDYEILANVSIEEVSEDQDTDISQTSSTSSNRLINQQGFEITSTLTDQTNVFLSNNKSTSLTVIKRGSFDIDDFYESARLHFHKRETDPIQKGSYTSINGDVNNKTIICILDDQEENEIVSSFEDKYNYMMIVDVSSYLKKEIEVEVLNDDKVLVKCSSMVNNDGELDHLKVFSRTFDIPTGLEIESGVCGVSLDGILAVTFHKKVSLDALQVKSSDEVCFTDNSEKDHESYNVEERVKFTREDASNTVDSTGRKLTLSNQDEEIKCSADTQALTDQIITKGMIEEQKSLSRDQNKFIEVSCSSDDAHQHCGMGGGSELAKDSSIQSEMESGRIQNREDSYEEIIKGEKASKVSLNLRNELDIPVDGHCVDSHTASGDCLRTFNELLSRDHNAEFSSDWIKEKGHLSIISAEELNPEEKILMANNIKSTQIINDNFSHFPRNIDSRERKESVSLRSSDNRKHETHDNHLDRCTDNDANENTKIMKQKTDVISSLENVISLGICENRSESKSVLPAVENGTLEIPCTDNCISMQVEERRLFSEDAFFDRARPHFAWPGRDSLSKVGHFASENDAHTDYKNLCSTAECNEDRISTFAQDEQYYMIILDVGINTKKTQIDIKVKEEKEVAIEWASLTSAEGQHLKPFSKRFDLPCGIDVESGFSGISSDGILIITFPKMNESSVVGRSWSQEDVSKGSTLTQTLTRDPNLTQSEGFILTPEGGRNCTSVSDVARWEDSNQETLRCKIATLTSASQSSFANVRLLPITKRRLFFHDSFFHEVHPLFQTAMENVLMSCTDDENCENASDIKTYHCLREQNPNLGNQAFHAQEDHHSYKVVLDVANLSEESMVVYVVDKKDLVIEGQVQKTGTSSSSLQSFKRYFPLPQTTEFIEATATLSSDGVLFVEFSKRIGVQRE